MISYFSKPLGKCSQEPVNGGIEEANGDQPSLSAWSLVGDDLEAILEATHLDLSKHKTGRPYFYLYHRRPRLTL
jgi:hypothetical protein